jgi:prepilin-type N-terminal cleavage/methylation domain-containing protein
MLSHVRHNMLERMRDAQGFTLIELLAAMAAGVAVTGALFSILDVSLHQTARLTDRVQVDQIGRTAMTQMVDELHSSCLSYSFAPILTESGPTEIRFINAYSQEAVVPKATEHRIAWDEKTGTITDSFASNTGGSWPNFTFINPTWTKVRIASNISRAVIKGKTEPIFKYFEYAEAATSTASTPLTAISTSELNSENAPKAASVKITFSQSPSNGYSSSTGVDRDAIFSTQTTLAFSVPKVEDPIHDAPCQ